MPGAGKRPLHPRGDSASDNDYPKPGGGKHGRGRFLAVGKETRKGTTMTIEVGAKIPSVTLTRMTDDGPAPISTDEIFAGKRVVLFAVPGAFTPTCSAQHLPGFVHNADAIKAKGVDTIACLAVNDVFVMDAWGKDQNVGGAVLMLADGNGEATRALGLEFDLSGLGLGVRSQRYAMVVDDGVVKSLNLDEGGGLEASAAERVLEKL